MGDAQAESDDYRDSLPSETVIDRRYVVQGMLGRGGMGYVYRVQDTGRDRVVALKQLTSLQPGLPGARAFPGLLGRRSAVDARKQAERLSLFRREYQTLADLAHPNIISAYEYGLHEGQPYYTMELLRGDDIGRLAPMAWTRACAVLRDVASALTLLHARRLLHRDLSPTNVHLTRDGTTKLIDFGAMGAMGPTSRVMGTPPFMAPEVLQLEELDARADLYALGALGFYLLTGRTVFPARSIAELCSFAGRRPEPPSSHVPQLPGT
ncbi:MAG TPA: serine/threonine-protein kinase, partial [Polyangiales bacterium]